VIWWVSWWWIDANFEKESERGLFGDKFGAVNALFSGLAFAGVIYAIVLQRQELELQREELRRSVEESSQQTKLFAEQLRNMQESLLYQKAKDEIAQEPVFRWLRIPRPFLRAQYSWR